MSFTRNNQPLAPRYDKPNDKKKKRGLAEYLMFVVKMCGAFGLGFELPVVLMFLGKIDASWPDLHR